MIDESLQVPLQENTPVIPSAGSIPSQPQKSKRKTWIIVSAILGVLCICAVVCVAVFGVGMFKVYTEKAPVEAVLDVYMKYMENKDTDSAYALFSTRAQRQIPISAVEEMLEGNNYYLFEGYQSLSVSNLNISATVNADQDVPQGTVANVTGIINYEDEFQGSFNGVLDKVGGKWMIDGIYVNLPPNKIK